MGALDGSMSAGDTNATSVVLVIEKEIRTNASRAKKIPAAQYTPDGSSNVSTW